ncbi:MAG: endolytic transglycosylase MltG [Candidatus Andersenbacteria bacterium]|nr:endolytic transglycosylase MltG [Candidatus Andersenbacteria bacterium]
MIQITNPKRFMTLVIALGAIVWLITWWLTSGSILKAGDFKVGAGSSGIGTGTTLKEEGYISRTLPWRLVLWRAGQRKPVQAGTYKLEAGEKLTTVVERMQKGEVVADELTITFPEGFTLKQIAARTAARGLGDEVEFLAAAKVGNFSSQFSFLAGLPATQSLEGYLFPDTYKAFGDDTPEDIIKRMLGNFDKKITPELREEVKQGGRTLDEIVNMASIVEREVNRTADLPKVADVLWKRYDEGGGLGADATVRYALNDWEKSLTVQDLALDSPYNTRKYKGLPPTAIGNPGLTAILAALRPEKNNFYYYLSTSTGETIFAKTNDEHNRNKAKYLR